MFLIYAIVSKLVKKVRFGVIGGVDLRGKTSKAFLVDINPKWLVGGYADVDSQVEFVTVY